jgi:opacity protein-like surface antigen
MSRTRLLAAAAADLPPLPPPMLRAPIIEDFSGWYLRGDIGFSNQMLGHLNQRTVTSNVRSVGMGFDAAPIFGIGVGYTINNWLRMDVTGEYRGSANFHGSHNVANGSNSFVDNYTARKSELLFLGNVYADLGTWWCLTPFVGLGIGGSRNSISSFRDDGLNLPGAGPPIASTTFGADASKWNFAWAVHAGLGYQVTPGLTMELSYRYLHLGDAMTGPLTSFDGVTVVNGGPFTFKDLTSHDFRLGVRWMLGEPPPPPPPLMRKG